MIARRSAFDPAELAEIERELDELDALLRLPRRPARALPAAGGGVIRTGRQLHNGLRPKPAAFAKAIAEGLNEIPAAFRAGYRAPNRMTAWRLLRDPKVRAEIDRLSTVADSCTVCRDLRPRDCPGCGKQLTNPKHVSLLPAPAGSEEGVA